MAVEGVTTQAYSSTNALPTIDEAAPLVVLMPLERIRPSPENPRRTFDQGALEELAGSIREHGILEPLVLRYVDGGSAEIVAGERRFRAAQLAGLAKVPARIIAVDDREAAQLRLVENLQRVDLNPVDEAQGFAALQKLGMRQAEIARAVHRAQPTIANAMRILELPDDVQERIRKGELTRGHGIALAKYKASPAVESALAEMAANGDFSVDWVENAFDNWQVEGELERKHLIRSVFMGQRFDRAICDACPFGARFGHHCLRPQHWQELQTAAEAERAVKTQEAVEQAKATGRELPKLRELAYGSYAEREHPPEGCDGHCPCAGQGIGYGDDVVPICTDKKRYDALLHRADRAKKAAARVRHKELVAKVEARLAALTADAFDDIAVQVLAVAALHGVPTKTATFNALKKLLPVGTLADDVKKYDRVRWAPALFRLPVVELARLALDAVLQAELKNAFEGYGSATTLTEAYLGEDATPAKEAP